MNGHGNCDGRGPGTGSSFANGNGGMAETMADWYAGSTDDRILNHWWCR
jgi:hypothetical protein